MYNDCHQCGHRGRDSLAVTYHGVSATFCSIQCMATKLAPYCARCNCRILGQRIYGTDKIYCSHHCAQETEQSQSA